MDDEPNGIPDGGTSGVKRPALDTIHNPQHKKFKTSELPLTAAQHAAIETLLYAVKKKGVFDHVRKTIWAAFNESVGHGTHSLWFSTAAILQMGLLSTVLGGKKRIHQLAN
jgi:hypothetical protein